jgi:hypothetical protein
MATFDYYSENKCQFEKCLSTCPSKYKSTLNYRLDLVSNFLGLVFVIEAFLKILALGLVCGRKAYLTSGWNIIDFIVVVTGIIEFTLEVLAVEGINFRGLRTLRVLRPLKGLKTVPSLRRQI